MRNKQHHKYTLANGDEVPSVTTILGMLGWDKHGLMYWANKAGKQGKDLDDVREELADAGKLCHKMAECYIKGLPGPSTAGINPAIVKKAEDSFEAFLRWKEMTRLELVASEVVGVSEQLRYGGRGDCVVLYHGDPGILDFKSSKQLYLETIVQVAGYRQIWNECHPDMRITANNHCFRWAPDGGFTHHAFSARQVDCGFAIFKRCREIYELRNALKDPTITEAHLNGAGIETIETGRATTEAAEPTTEAA